MTEHCNDDAELFHVKNMMVMMMMMVMVIMMTLKKILKMICHNDFYQYANDDVDYLSDSNREFLMALQWLGCHDDQGFFEDFDDDVE